MLLRQASHYGYWDQAGDGTGGGSGGAAASIDGNTAGGNDSSGAQGNANAQANGGQGGGAGGDANAGSGSNASQDQGTLLSKAAAEMAKLAQAAGQQPGVWDISKIPEKYQVKGADGKIDVAATLGKVDQARSELETRMGSTGLPPASADEYKPDSVLAAIKEKTNHDVNLDPELAKAFREKAHKLGLTQTQFEGVLTEHFNLAQQLVDQAFDFAMKNGQNELVKVWGKDGVEPGSEKMRAAYRAFTKFAPPALKTAQIMDQIGNHPVVMQLLAAVGQELKEDKPLHPDGGQGTGEQFELSKLMNSNAYWNSKHPEHEGTVARVKTLQAQGITVIKK